MMNAPLTLVEWSRVNDVALDDDEVLAIEDSSAGIEVRHGKTAGHFTLRATHFVGTLVLPRRRITLLPKVPVGTLFELLGWVDRVAMGPIAPGELDPDVTRAMARTYVSVLEEALGRAGVLGEWLWLDQDASSFSGRIDWMHLFMRRFGVIPPIRVSKLELDEDSPLNRRLYAALDSVRRLLEPRDLPMERVRRLVRHFSNTTLVRRPEPARVDRRTLIFGRALTMADAILQSMSIRFEMGTRPVATFLADMNVLFESFLLGNMEAILETSSYRLRKHPRGFAFDEQGQLPLTPDGVLVGRDGRALAVIDAKYKAEVTQADLNQVMAYCTTSQVQHGILVVAGAQERVVAVRGSPLRIYVRSLALDGDASQVRSRIERLVEFLVTLVSGRSA